MNVFGMILLSAALSSALTLAVAWLLFEHRYKRRLMEEVDQRVEDYQARFAGLLEAERERAGEMIEERVRKGIVTGVASIPSPETVQETTRKAVRSGVDLMEEGLATFLGGKKPRRR